MEVQKPNYLFSKQLKQVKVISKNNVNNIVGEARLEKMKGGSKIIPIVTYVVKSFPLNYSLIDKQNNELGFTSLHLYSSKENKIYGVDYEYSKFPGAVYVEDMYSSADGYVGIGNALHEIAVNISKNAGYSGRVLLDAEKSSHIFHYKFGFRSLGERCYIRDESIENEIEKAERKIQKGIISSMKDHDTSHLSPIPMYLPEEIIRTIVNRTQVVFY